MSILTKEHPTCKGCKWNKFPLCNGTKIDGEFMQIDSLKSGFKCGVKDSMVIIEHYENEKDPNTKSLEDEIIELKQRIASLETA